MITLANAAAITKAKLETLRPEFKAKAREWFGICVEKGLVPYVYEGWRSPARQKALFSSGRTAPGRIVTNAEPWQSFHQYGLAFDWVPLVRCKDAVAEKAVLYEADWDNHPMYAVGADIAKDLGMRSLSWEEPHLELASFANWREVKAKYGEQKEPVTT